MTDKKEAGDSDLICVINSGSTMLTKVKRSRLNSNALVVARNCESCVENFVDGIKRVTTSTVFHL